MATEPQDTLADVTRAKILKDIQVIKFEAAKGVVAISLTFQPSLK